MAATKRKAGTKSKKKARKAARSTGRAIILAQVARTARQIAADHGMILSPEALRTLLAPGLFNLFGLMAGFVFVTVFVIGLVWFNTPVSK